MKKIIYLALISMIISACGGHTKMQDSMNTASEEKLLRESYVSQIANEERDYYVYLPRGYDSNSDKQWPLMLFLHGNGERGDGKEELDYVLKHGPLYEAWVQKKDIPFIIISPQLHMFGVDKLGLDYIDNRTLAEVPRRQKKGTPPRPGNYGSPDPMTGEVAVNDMQSVEPLLPNGWEKVEKDLLGMLETVQKKYRVDRQRVVLTGLSYGGFGTWFMASEHPQKFAAILPVVGWGHPTLMKPIADNKVPVWAFAGGRDTVVQPKHFYKGLNKLESLGHDHVRFTIHEDMGHDTWTRVYASDDTYNWLLQHELKSE